jgi:hypothetical protein
MQQQGPGLRSPLSPLELTKHLPGETFATSDGLRWVGLQAHRYREQPPNEAFVPPLTHHSLLLFLRAPKEFELRSDLIRRVVPPAAGSILMMPAGTSTWWRWGRHSDSLHVFLEPKLVARVTAAAFELDPAQVSVPPLDGLQHPQLRATMLELNNELTTPSAGGRIAIESLANLLAVHLIRHASAPRAPRAPDRRRASSGETPHRRRVHRGTPRRRPDPGADRGIRPPQRVPLRAAVQGGHRDAAAPVRHCPPCRTSKATPAGTRRPLARGRRRGRWVLGSKPLLQPVLRQNLGRPVNG